MRTDIYTCRERGYFRILHLSFFRMEAKPDMDLEVLDARNFTGSVWHKQAAVVGVCERHNGL